MATIVLHGFFLELVFRINEKSYILNPVHYKIFLYLQQITISHILHVPK